MCNVLLYPVYKCIYIVDFILRPFIVYLLFFYLSFLFLLSVTTKFPQREINKVWTLILNSISLI